MTAAPRDTAEGDALPSAADKLLFADIEPPPPGGVAQIGGGVHWLRMPLPGDLNHINLWLIEHNDGFVLVDTGMALDESRDAWLALEQTLLKQRPLRLIVVTHLHPDHVGLAEWLQSRYRVPVWMSRTTEHQVRDFLTPQPEAEVLARTSFLISHGIANTRDIAAALIGEKYRGVVSGIPQVMHHPEDAEEVMWGGVSWQFIEVGGHAAGHLCLHAPALKLLISGDQVLPSISPNVSLHETRLDANPLGTYLSSLERLARLDEQTLVLPSHGRPFCGLRTRATDIRDHHHAQLEKLRKACAQSLTAESALPVMFARTLKGFHRFLAIGEAIAHLEYLAAEGQVARSVDATGLVHFEAR
jgi:glyoxylase-like metal-dependent hydrolase (beta-lactamase superfamily II)